LNLTCKPPIPPTLLRANKVIGKIIPDTTNLENFTFLIQEFEQLGDVSGQAQHGEVTYRDRGAEEFEQLGDVSGQAQHGEVTYRDRGADSV